MRFSGGFVINPHDAALIAAAPDLLRVLTDLRKELQAADLKLNVKKHFSLLAADAAAGTIIHNIISVLTNTTNQEDRQP